jgi:hypothetical protein
VVRGALVLGEVFADEPAGFGVLMSSLAPVLGGRGDAVHAAAGRFLDACASDVTSVTGVAWEGSAFPGAGRDGQPRDPNLPYPSPEQEAEILGLVLGSGMPSRLAVCRTDLEQLVRRRRSEPRPSRSAAPASAARPGGEELKRVLAELWSEVLRTEVGRYDLTFFDLGGDELLAVRLARRVEERLGVPLPAIELLGNPTVDRLAARLDPQRAEEPSPHRRGTGRAG